MLAAIPFADVILVSMRETARCILIVVSEQRTGHDHVIHIDRLVVGTKLDRDETYLTRMAMDKGYEVF